MCIAIYKPAKVVLTKNLLKTCFNNNPHGAGFAFPNKDNRKVIIEKGFFKFREFWMRYRVVAKLKRPMLIHFRVATSGKIDKDNCHPWRIDLKHALVHNGVLQHRLGLESNECSDTGQFVEYILKPTFEKNQKVWRLDQYKWMIEHSIGGGNKLAILDHKGRIVIFNEEKGEWHNDAWFSNQTYKNSRKTFLNVGDTWVEETENGKKFATRRNGKVTYRYVKNPLALKSESEKITKFAERQTGVTISPKAETLGLKKSEEKIFDITAEQAEEIFDTKEVEPSMLI